MPHYIVLTTFPEGRASANVGDQLIEVSTKALIERERGKARFTTLFREEPLDARLDEINRADAVLLPGFAIRDTPVYPGCYRLCETLEAITVPLIPIGANWNVYPGDRQSREELRYSAATTGFLRRVAAGVARFSCREYHACRILARHGIGNAVLTGDPAWYDPAFFGVPMHRPEKIESVVFSPPLSPFYGGQAREVLALLAELYPNARRYCAMHLADSRANRQPDSRPANDASMLESVAEKNARVRRDAAELGFEVREVAGDVGRIEFYKECDLHVGYECHAHLSFLRWRRPSVLIAEDARGVGFNDTLGTARFNGFLRCQGDREGAGRAGGTSGYCITLEEYATAPCDHALAGELRNYLREESASAFRRCAGIARFIDETYASAMAPFLRALP